MKPSKSQTLLFNASLGSFLALASVIGLPAASEAAIATLSGVSGEVYVQSQDADADQWTPAATNMELASGDTLKTAKGTCAIVYGDSATVQVAENTTLEIIEQEDTQDVNLLLGNISANVDHDRTVKPFQFITATAVSAVRGTQVDFGFDEDGLLTIDLKNGDLLVFNDDEELVLDLTGGNKVSIYYDYATGSLSFKNSCESGGDVEFLFRGKVYTTKPCEEITTDLETATGQNAVPSTTGSGDNNSETVPGEGDEDKKEEIPQGISDPFNQD